MNTFWCNFSSAFFYIIYVRARHKYGGWGVSKKKNIYKYAGSISFHIYIYFVLSCVCIFSTFQNNDAHIWKKKSFVWQWDKSECSTGMHVHWVYIHIMYTRQPSTGLWFIHKIYTPSWYVHCMYIYVYVSCVCDAHEIMWAAATIMHIWALAMNIIKYEYIARKDL